MVNPFRSRAKKVVRIHLQSALTLERSGPVEIPGVTLEGLLIGETRRHVILHAAKVLKDEGESETISGPVEVPRARELFRQVIA